MRYLFLDDVRVPTSVGNYILPKELRPIYYENVWEIVRSYKEFVSWIQSNGLPDIVSFDHDLAEIHYDPSTWKEGFKYKEETGYDCAKWLVEYCIDKGIDLPKWFVHSMNPIGKEKIENLLKKYTQEGSI